MSLQTSLDTMVLYIVTIKDTNQEQSTHCTSISLTIDYRATL